MHMHQTLKELRLKHHLKQAEVAQAVGVTQGSVSLWEHNRSLPDRDKIPLLAKLFDVPEQVLYHGLDEAEKTWAQMDQKPDDMTNVILLERDAVYANGPATVPLVILGRVHAGSFEQEELVGRSVEVPASVLRNHPHAMAVVVEGNCMNRVAPDGSIAVFDPNLEPSNGRIAIVETQDHEAIMRRWYRGARSLMLSPDSYEPFDDIIIEGDQPIKVIGTVVHIHIPDELL